MLPLLGAGLVVGGTWYKASAASKAGKQNQAALYGQALEEEVAGAEQELRIRGEARKAIGAQFAAQSSNGFLGNTGSALDALAESQTNAVLDALTVRREAAAKARSLRAEGDMRRSAAKFDAVSALIGGADKLVGMAGDWAAAKAPYQGGG